MGARRSHLADFTSLSRSWQRRSGHRSASGRAVGRVGLPSAHSAIERGRADACSCGVGAASRGKSCKRRPISREALRSARQRFGRLRNWSFSRARRRSVRGIGKPNTVCAFGRAAGSRGEEAAGSATERRKVELCELGGVKNYILIHFAHMRQCHSRSRAHISPQLHQDPI